MNRPTILAATILVVALLSPGAALAAKPTREPLPVPPTFDITGSCQFDVRVDVLANDEFIAVLTSGKTIVTGRLILRLTNVDEPSQSITLNVSGPSINDSSDPSTINLSGTSLLFYPGVLMLTKGPVAIKIDENGNVTSVRFTSAAAVDLCAALG